MANETEIKEVQSHSPNLSSVFGLTKISWDLFKARFGYFIKLAFLPAILLGISNADFVQRALIISVPQDIISKGPNFLGLLFFFLIFLIVYSWAIILTLQGIKNSEGLASVGQLVKDSLISLPAFLWTQILLVLTVMGGYILLLVPGIILSISCGFTVIVFIAEGVKGTTAIGRSRDYVRGKWWAVFGRFAFISILSSILYFLLVALFGLLRFPEKLMLVTFISSLLVLPFTLIYLYQLFIELREIKITTSTTETPKRSNLVLPLIGFLAGAALIISFMIFFGRLQSRNADLLKEVRSLNPTELSQCENPHPVLGKDGCFQKVAEYKLDPDICSMIGDLEQLSNCFSNVAMNKKDATICGRIPKDNFWRDHCYTAVAEARADNTICNEIEGGQPLWSCYDAVAAAGGDPEACFNLPPGASPDFCLSKVAKKVKKPLICGRILNPQLKDFCYADVAYELQDKAVCDQYISDPETKQRCNTNLQANPTSQGNYSVETANWKVYRYDKYNFQISYPPDWSAYISTTLEAGALGFNSPKDGGQGNFMNFTIQRYDLDSKSYPPQTLNISNATVDGVNAYRDEGYVRNPDGPSSQSIWLKKDSFVYSLTFQVFKQFSLPSQYEYQDIKPARFTLEEEKIRDAFISTFEFLE